MSPARGHVSVGGATDVPRARVLRLLGVAALGSIDATTTSLHERTIRTTEHICRAARSQRDYAPSFDVLHLLADLLEHGFGLDDRSCDLAEL